MNPSPRRLRVLVPLLLAAVALCPLRADQSPSANPAPPSERRVKYYKSTMMAGEVRQTPGKDSMGMDMAPVYEGEDNSSAAIRIDAATTQRMNLRTSVIERGPVRREIRTVGVVAYDEQGLRDITTKYDGWLQKLQVSATWTQIRAGDPLFEIYSPDLYNAQLNYVVALGSEGAAGGPLTRAALSRLQLFDVPADLIADLARTGRASRTLVFRAPADGVVIEKMAVEGQMMKAGERIYRLADLSTVWVLAQVYEKDLGFVRKGQAAVVTTTYGAQRTFKGTVELLLLQVDEQTRAATARIVLDNKDLYLRPGMFADVRFQAELSASAVLVPDTAVLRSGDTDTVFVVNGDGSFEPRAIKLGERSEGDFYEVLSGLRASERVVTSGQFMLDSESQLREAIQKMIRGDAAPGPAAPAAKSPDGRRITHYKSSMMAGEVSDKPAKDSMGMDMVPVYGDEASPSGAASAPPQAAGAPGGRPTN